jgi:hypothetical protein
LKGEKAVLKLSVVLMINVPKLPELGVRRIIDQIKDKEKIQYYLPKNYDKKRTICRVWFYNIVNTVYPGWLDILIAHAQSVRQTPNPDEEGNDAILCTPEFHEQLKNTSFVSSKSSHNHLTPLFLQRRKARCCT